MHKDLGPAYHLPNLHTHQTHHHTHHLQLISNTIPTTISLSHTNSPPVHSVIIHIHSRILARAAGTSSATSWTQQKPSNKCQWIDQSNVEAKATSSHVHLSLRNMAICVMVGTLWDQFHTSSPQLIWSTQDLPSHSSTWCRKVWANTRCLCRILFNWYTSRGHRHQ